MADAVHGTGAEHRELRNTSRLKEAIATGNNISIPKRLLTEIQSAARAEHRIVDEVLVEAVTRYLENRSWTSLLHYGAERARKPGITESDVDRLIAESRAEQRSH